MKIYSSKTILILLISVFILSCSDDDSSVIDNVVNEVEETADETIDTVTEEVEEIVEEETPEEETPEEETPEEEEMETNEVLTGSFVGVSPYTVRGDVVINEERTQLTITGFFVSSPGITLALYFLTDPDSRVLAPAEYVSAGELQGLTGDFTYDIPEGINFETYPYLSVWCVPASLNFGHTLLE